MSGNSSDFLFTRVRENNIDEDTMHTKQTTDYITTKEAAALLNVDESQVRRYCIEGKLPCRKHGRDWLILRADTECFVPPPRGRPKKTG